MSSAWASADVCQEPVMQSRLSFGFDTQDDAPIDQGPGEIGLENRETDLRFKTASNRALFGIRHRYSIFDIESLQAATNGHLHTYILPLHVLSGDERKGFRFSIAPAWSLSSNVGDRFDEYKDDSFQLLAALIWGRQLSERTGLHFGVCGDHRFGDYQVYPSLSVHLQFHPDWNLQLGFPNSRLSYQVSAPLSSTLRVGPDGNEWFVLDKTLAINSQFVYEAFSLEWIFDWQFHESLTFSASVGRQIHNRYEMTLVDQRRVRLSGDPVTRVGAALQWRF
jgi:hypothetical protein